MTKKIGSKIALSFCIVSKSCVGISREQPQHTLKLTKSRYYYCSVPTVTVSILLSAKCHSIFTAQYEACHSSNTAGFKCIKVSLNTGCQNCHIDITAQYQMSQYHYCSVPNLLVSLMLSAKRHNIITAQRQMSQYHNW
jgi:hypothetical protein